MKYLFIFFAMVPQFGFAGENLSYRCEMGRYAEGVPEGKSFDLQLSSTQRSWSEREFARPAIFSWALGPTAGTPALSLFEYKRGPHWPTLKFSFWSSEHFVLEQVFDGNTQYTTGHMFQVDSKCEEAHHPAQKGSKAVQLVANCKIRETWNGDVHDSELNLNLSDKEHKFWSSKSGLPGQDSWDFGFMSDWDATKGIQILWFGFNPQKMGSWRQSYNLQVDAKPGQTFSTQTNLTNGEFAFDIRCDWKVRAP